MKRYTLRHYYNSECYEIDAAYVTIEKGQYLFFAHDGKEFFDASFSTRGWDIVHVELIKTAQADE